MPKIGILRSLFFNIPKLEKPELKFKSTYIHLCCLIIWTETLHFSLHFLSHPCLRGSYGLIQHPLDSKDKSYNVCLCKEGVADEAGICLLPHFGDNKTGGI